MAATCKTELLNILHKEFGKLAKFVDSIDADRALEKNDDDTSIKDVIAHRAHWIELFLDGMSMAFPEKKFTFQRKATNGTISNATIPI
jgi:hypothetical protein